MSVSWCRSRLLYDDLTRASNILCALFVLHGARAPVCVCAGGGGVPLS